MFLSWLVSGNIFNKSHFICKLFQDSKISPKMMSTGTLWQGQRAARYSAYLQQVESRRLLRCNYWAGQPIVEISTIISIAWYLQMEVFRMQKLPSSMTPLLFQTCSDAQEDIPKQAQCVYIFKLYSGNKYSEFPLSDTTQDDLNGCLSRIQWYNSVAADYPTIIYPKFSGQKQDTLGMSMFVMAENMEPIRREGLSMYNCYPRLPPCQASMKNSSSDDPETIMSVCFHDNILLQMCIQLQDKL